MIDDTPMLRGLKLTRTYGEGATLTHALREVSMDLFRGQLVLLMGPSGSGKSTLLAVMSGLLKPDQGHVMAHDGESLRDVWEMTPRSASSSAFAIAGLSFRDIISFLPCRPANSWKSSFAGEMKRTAAMLAAVPMRC